MPTVNVERIKDLIRHLEAVKKDLNLPGFSMLDWTCDISDLRHTREDYEKELDETENPWAQGELARAINVIDAAEMHSCPTVCCIAGHLKYLNPPLWYETQDLIEDEYDRQNKYSLLFPHNIWHITGARLLGITPSEARKLFNPRNEEVTIDGEDATCYQDAMAQINLDDAIKTLKHLAETGEVKWELD